ncbi:MAG: DUF4973 domain-containing protein [Clostridium sp.]|nr:DUF4973 domain-containing protein [Clostridium sp.]
MKLTNILSYCLIGAAAMSVTSCNDDWDEEQYEHYVGFVAPLDTEGTSVGVTTVYIPFTRKDENKNPLYGEKGISHYELPVQVAGSTVNPTDLTVNIVHSDTLDALNPARFSNRTDIWFHDMSAYAEYPSQITIPAGKDIALLNIRFDFRNLDLADKYVLPLTINDPMRNPLKNFATAMLRVLPYTDYSGIYQATNLKYYLIDKNGNDGEEPGAMNTVQTYVVDDDVVFFYAGTINEESQMRKSFKIFARFTPDEDNPNHGSVEMWGDPESPEMNFVQVSDTHFTILEVEDEVQSYIMRKTVIMNGVDYTYDDTKTAPGSVIRYHIRGTMTMERKLNTQKPEEYQIEF